MDTVSRICLTKFSVCMHPCGFVYLIIHQDLILNLLEKVLLIDDILHFHHLRLENVTDTHTDIHMDRRTAF